MYAAAIRTRPTVSWHLMESVERYLTEILDVIEGPNWRTADAALNGGAMYRLSASRIEIINELVSLHMLLGSHGFHGSYTQALRFLDRVNEMDTLHLEHYRTCLAKLGVHFNDMEKKLEARKHL